ncbi:MAG: PD40 domain-containing protein [Verrucomicrobia bacterium]|nr:PD40 domain-containing protein [Verrucomicrobiota bacterium]
MKLRQLCITYALALLVSSSLYAEEVFDTSLERLALPSVQQVTFPEMGFEKAGEAYFSPDGNSLIFQAVPHGQEHYQMYVMDLETRIPHMVSTGLGACSCGYFRPDGKKIIFASSHSDPELANPDFTHQVPGYKRSGGSYSWAFTPYMNIYEANPDGSELTPLTQGAAYNAECGYSPDGSQIVFASNRSGSMNLYTMQADGSNVQQVTHTTDCYNGGSFFSPDGEQIIFRADREKQHYLQLYVIDADGTNERQLTSNGAVNWAPYWHPNGKVVAFTTSLHGHAHYEIYLLNIVTGDSFRLTHNASFDGLPSFSYDGTKMVWTSKRSVDQSCQLFVAEFLMPEEMR